MYNKISQFLQDNRPTIKKVAFLTATASSTYLTFLGSKIIIDADDHLNSMQQLQLGMTWILFNIQCVTNIASIAQKAHTSNKQISAKFLEGLICGNFLGNLPLSFHYFQKLGDMVDQTQDNTLKEEPEKFELR